MEIGKPQRVFHVEPVENPVPRRPEVEPVLDPDEAPVEVEEPVPA